MRLNTSRLLLPAVLAMVMAIGFAMITTDNVRAAESSTSPDTGGTVGSYSSMKLDSSGYPVMAYYDSTNGNLKILHCGNANCTSGNSTVTVNSAADDGTYTSLALDSNGYPVVSYYDVTNSDLKILHCSNANCTSGSINTPDSTGDVGEHTSIQIRSNGYPFVSYYDETNGNLKFVDCGDANCSSGNRLLTVNSTPDDGVYTSLALDNDVPVVSYQDVTNGDLKVARCTNASCNPLGITINTPDSVGSNTGEYSSLQLDSNKYPVVAYRVGSDLKILHCNDVNCASGGDQINTADGDGTGPLLLGYYNSLILDGSGYPVIAHYIAVASDVRVVHCNDANCAGGNENINVPDGTAAVGLWPSISLDGSGYPVISHYDATNGDLKLLHCDDANCASP